MHRSGANRVAGKPTYVLCHSGRRQRVGAGRRPMTGSATIGNLEIRKARNCAP